MFRYDGTDSRMNLEDALGDQLDDYLMGGVWIDFQGFAEFANGRKRITGVHLSGDDRFFGGIDDLFVSGEAGLEIDAERDHLRIMTASTAKGNCLRTERCRRGRSGGGLGPLRRSGQKGRRYDEVLGEAQGRWC
jgi:hypothetical protein